MKQPHRTLHDIARVVAVVVRIPAVGALEPLKVGDGGVGVELERVVQTCRLQEVVAEEDQGVVVRAPAELEGVERPAVG